MPEKTIPQLVERMAGQIGWRTTSLTQTVYRWLNDLSVDDQFYAGVIRRGERWHIRDETKFTEWLLGQPKGRQFGLNEIPSNWTVSDFVEKAEGHYSLRDVTNRLKRELMATHDALGGASSWTDDQRSVRGIFRSEGGAWAIDAEPYIKWLRDFNYLIGIE